MSISLDCLILSSQLLCVLKVINEGLTVVRMQQFVLPVATHYSMQNLGKWENQLHRQVKLNYQSGD